MADFTLARLSDEHSNAWDDVVSRSKEGSFYHRLAWLQVLEEGLGAEPRHFVVEKSGTPIAVFPNFHVKIDSTPFYRLSSLPIGYGGPVISKNHEDCFSLFVNEIPNRCSGYNTISSLIISSKGEYTKYARPLSRAGYGMSLNHLRFVLDIDRPWERILNDFSSDRKWELRKIPEDRVEFQHADLTDTSLNRFYDIYREVMENELKEDYHPKSLFDAIFTYASEHTELIFTTVDGDDAGAFLHFLDDTVLHHHFGPVKPEFFDMYLPTEMHRHSMKWAKNEGLKQYDFGATAADFSEGLFGYKSQFGGDIEPYFTWERGLKRVKWWLFRQARKVYKSYNR